MIFVYNADVLFWKFQTFARLLHITGRKAKIPRWQGNNGECCWHTSPEMKEKKNLRKKREKKSPLSGRNIFAPIWGFFLCGSPRVYIPIPVAHVPLCILSAGSHPSNVILLIFLPTCSCGSTRAARMINHPIGGQDGPCSQTQRTGRPLSRSMGRQRSSTNMQEQSPANLLHSGQRDSSRDKQPPVERPVYCGQRVGWVFRPGSNSG